MDDAKRDLVRSWLIKADHDLATARKIAAGPDAYLDTAIYHCQQAAEKVVKGFLTYHDQPLHRTHDIEFLVGAAAPFEPRFTGWADAGARLTRYATAFRYPGPILEPDADEFSQALVEAQALCDFVFSLLPGEVHP